MNLHLAKLLDRWLGSAASAVIGASDVVHDAIRPPAVVASVDHLLVVKFWGLGNWALLRPIVKDLSERWPGVRVTVATLASNRPLVEDLADDLLLVRPRGLGVVGADLTRALLFLRRHTPDLAVDFEQFSRTGSLLSRLGGARQRVGFACPSGGRDALYTALVPFRTDVHASRSFRDLAEAAGLAPGPYVPGGLAGSAPARARRDVRLGHRPYVVFHPGSGDNFPGRRWSEASFAAVARVAVRHGHTAVLTGTSAESGLVERIARAVGRGALPLAGHLRVEDLVAVVEGARAVVSNDTGPVHLASALGVPTLAVYGPNTPVLYGPLAPGSRAFYKHLPCSPCLTTSNYRSSRCRIFTCTASVRTGEVATALVDVLARSANRERPTQRENACRGTSS